MRREMLRSVAAVSSVGALAVLSASAGPIELWDPPAGTSVEAPTAVDPGEPAPLVEPEVAVEQQRVADDSTDSDSGVLAILLAVLALASFVFAGRWIDPAVSTISRRGRRRRGVSGEEDPVETIDVREAVIDVESARRVLLEGRPRDAIVACWIQLERTVADAGIVSDPGETPSQYVRRVVAGRSLDPGPISALAELYREARFSLHDLTDVDRDRAAAALERIADALAVDARADA